MSSQWRITVISVLWVFAFQGDGLLEDNFLLTLDGKAQKIYQVSLETAAVHELPLSDHFHPVAVDYDPINKMVFWTDVGKNSENPTVNSAKVSGEDQKVIVTLTRGSSPEGIAVDPYERLVFYADNGPDHIRVLKYDGLEERSVIVEAHNPRCVRVDPVQRHIYWTDWGSGTIEKALYDGSNRTKIINQPGAWINNVAIDFQSRLMYWTDAKTDVVKFASMDTGLGEQTLVSAGDQILVHYYGVALDANKVYISDWTQGKLYYTSKTSNNLTALNTNHTFSVVNSLHAYVSDLYPKSAMPGPCSTNTSGCQQFCLALGGGTDYTCQCNDQTQLKDDGVSCELIDTGSSNGPDVIWLEFDGSNTGYVRGVNGKPQNFLRNPSLQTWLIRSPLWHWTSLDFDAKNQRLFLIDKFDKYVTQLSLGSNLQLETVHYGLSGEADGIAYDWLSNSLYWTDALYNWIRVAKAQPNVDQVRTILKDLDHPHGIAVDPKAGMMFWADRGIQDQILSARLSGEDKKVIVSSDIYLNKPTGITLDKNKIYWCNVNQLMSANQDGTNIKILFATTAKFVGITVQDNYVMAVDKGVGNNSPYLWFFNVNSPTRVPKMPLYREPLGITMYNSDLQPHDMPTMRCEVCDHICVSNPLYANHTQCLCSDGYALAPDNTTCTALPNSARPGFVYSLGSKICHVAIEDIQKTSLDLDQLCFYDTPGYFFPALDFDYKMGEIYFSETKQATKTIRRANLNDRDNNAVVVYGVGDVYGLAVDYVSDNLYWADYSRGQIWVSRVDGTFQTLLLDNRVQPRALVLNTRSRKLYWSEFRLDGTCVILSANTDGSQLEPLVIDDLENITGLFVDYSLDRLYFVDQGEGEVESISFAGTDREKEENLNKLLLNAYDLALFQDIVGLSETPVTSDLSTVSAPGLHLAVLSTGQAWADELTYPDTLAAYDVLAFNQANQPSIAGDAANSCAAENGFCEQLCLHVNTSSYRCACVDGMKLAADGSSCQWATVKKDKMLLVANDYRHTIHGLDPSDLTSFYSYNLPPMDRPISVTYDPVKGYLYWSEFMDGMIKRMFMDGSDVRVIKSGETGSKVNGIALDPDTENLYYADSFKREIGILSPTGAYHKVLIQDRDQLANVHCIVLDVPHGYMYFTVTQRGDIGKILRADLDGKNISLIVTSLKAPTGLVLDTLGHQLYWADSGTNKLEVASLNGENRRLVYQLLPNAHPFGIALVDKTLFWTDWNDHGLFHVDTDGTKNGVLFENEFHGLNGLVYVNMDSMAPNTCTVTTGPKCTHFCIPTPNTPKCLCPDPDDSNSNSLNCTAQTCSQDVLFGTLSRGCTAQLGDQCQYTCLAGYVNTTDTTLTCGAGFEWDKDVMALCQVGTCPGRIDHGSFGSVCGMTVGEQCHYTCDEGYVKLSDSPLECLIDLQWNHTLANICQKGTCPALELPTYTKTSTQACREAVVPGTECKLHCSHNHSPQSGDSKVTCLPDYTWQGTPLRCKDGNPCSSPGSIPNTRVVPEACANASHQFWLDDTCSYSCVDGFTKTSSGADRRMCISTGTWSGTPIKCVAMTSSTITPTTGMTPGPIVAVDPEKLTSNKKSNTTAIVVGTIFAVAVLATFLVVVAVIMYKRSQRGLGHYRSSSNYASGKADDLVPVVGKDELCPSYHSQGDAVDLYGHQQQASVNNNLYTNQPEKHFKMDGSVAFTNPDYEEVEIKAATEALGTSEDIPYDMTHADAPAVDLPEVEVRVVPGPGAEDRTAFTNPLYSNQAAFTLGEESKESQS